MNLMRWMAVVLLGVTCVPAVIGGPLHDAVRHENVSQAKHLIEGGAKIEAKDSYGRTPLHLATNSLNTSMVEALINHGADINAVDKESNTPLHHAIRQLYDSLVKIAHQTGNYPFDHPLNTSIVEMLISGGANVNAINKEGNTPLHLATLVKHASLAEILIKNGANTNIVNSNGYIPLQIAIKEGSTLSLFELLVNEGSNVNVTDKKGDTPLHFMASLGNWTTVKLLLSKGANINAKNNKGETPWDVAVGKAKSTLEDELLKRLESMSWHARAYKTLGYWVAWKRHDYPFMFYIIVSSLAFSLILTIIVVASSSRREHKSQRFHAKPHDMAGDIVGTSARGYLNKLKNGEFGFSKTLLLYGVLLNVIAAVTLSVVLPILFTSIPHPAAFTLSALACYLCFIIYDIFVLRGVFNAAKNNRKENVDAVVVFFSAFVLLVVMIASIIGPLYLSFSFMLFLYGPWAHL